jgi:hypothetical protein
MVPFISNDYFKNQKDLNKDLEKLRFLPRRSNIIKFRDEWENIIVMHFWMTK